MKGRQGLYANINRRKKLGISRPKSKSTISAKALLKVYPVSLRPSIRPAGLGGKFTSSDASWGIPNHLDYFLYAYNPNFT